MVEIQELSLAEVARHNQEKDLWICIHGNVYNVSEFIDEHPGGEEVLRTFAGTDATEAFEDAAHSEDVKEIMDGLMVGKLPLTYQERHDVVEPIQPLPQTAPAPTQQSDRTSRQNHAAQKRSVSRIKSSLGAILAIVVALTLFATGLGPMILLMVAGTMTPILLLVYCFIAATSRHRGADAYPDYIKPSIPT